MSSDMVAEALPVSLISKRVIGDDESGETAGGETPD